MGGVPARSDPLGHIHIEPFGIVVEDDIDHPAEGPEVTPTTLLVPLVGFDGDGHRLGYGAGFFDRTLAALKPRPLTIGIGFELGRLETIAPQPHDQPMDLIITEAGVFGDIDQQTR